MKKFVIFVISLLLCFNNTMVVFGEDDITIENEENIESVLETENIENAEILIENSEEDENFEQEDTIVQQINDETEENDYLDLEESSNLEQTDTNKLENFMASLDVPADVKVIGSWGGEIYITSDSNLNYLNKIKEIRFYGCREENDDYITCNIATKSSKNPNYCKLYYNFSLFPDLDSDLFIKYDDKLEIDLNQCFDYFEIDYADYNNSSSYTIKIIADGYKDYVSSKVFSFKGPKSVSNPKIDVSDNGDLIISYSSSGTNNINDVFLTGLTKNGEKIIAPDGTTRTFSSLISFILPPDGNTIYTSDINCSCYDLNLAEHSLTIPKAVLQTLGITDNQKIKVMLYVHGYHPTNNDVTLIHQEKNDDFYVSQDKNGDVYITSTNSDLLNYLNTEPTGTDDPQIYFMSGNTQHGITKKPNNINEHNAYYEVLCDNNNNPQSILIKEEVLLAHYVPSKVVEFSCVYNSENYSSNAVIKACKDFPSDLSIEEKNDRLEISTSDKAFLNALLMSSDTTYNSVTEEKNNISGSSVSFLKDGYYYALTNAISGYVQEEIFYDEDNSIIYINEETLKGNNIPADTLTCLLRVYGYADGSKTVTLSDSIACKSDTIVFDIEQNDNGDIIVTSNNTDFINQLVKERKYTPSPNFKTYEYGSHIRLIDTDGNYYSFNNQHCDSQITSNEINIIKVNDTTAKIPFEKIVGSSNYKKILEGTVISKVQLNVFGYTEQESDIELTIDKGVKQAPNDITVEEDIDTGDIIISSNDLDYLQALTKERNNNDETYSHIEIQIKDGVNNFYWYSNYQGSEEQLIYNEADKTVTIPNEFLLSRNICKGLHDIYLCAFGYTDVYKEDVELINACTECPTGVTATLDSSGNLIIKSADTVWTQTLVPSEDSNDSYISFDNGEDNYRLYSSYNNLKISSDKKTITVPAKDIYANGVPNGTHTVSIYAYGYECVTIPKAIKITKGCKTIKDSDINFVLNEDGSITIKSNVTGFIEALSKNTVDKMYDNVSKNTYAQGGIVWVDSFSFRGYEAYYNGKLENKYSPFVLSKDKKSLTITKEAILNTTGRIGKKLLNGTYSVSFSAPGYVSVHKNITINNSPIDLNVPNDVDISLDSSLGLKISSSNSEWLEGIVKTNNDYYFNDVATVRLYLDSEYQEAINNDGYAYCLGFMNTDGDISILEGEGYVYIPTDELTAAFASYGSYDDEDSSYPNGDYHITITSYGYDKYDNDDAVEFNLLKQHPNNITITQGNNRIVINSDDKEYLKQLARECDNKTTWFNNILIGTDSEFEDNPLFITNNNEQQILTYDEDGEYTYFDLDYLKMAYGKYMDVDTLYFSVRTLGYTDYESQMNQFDLILECDELILGAATQLSFNDHGTVTWSSSDEDILSVDSEGIVTAKKIGSAIIYASGDDGVGDSIHIPVVSNKKVSISVSTNDKSTTAMINDPGKSLVVTSKNYTLNPDVDVITYSSSDDEIASVDEYGNITFKKAGIVTLYAEAIGKKASVKISVYSVEKNLKISAKFNTFDDFFEVGDSGIDYTIETDKSNGEIIDASLLTYKSSNESIVTVDEEGKLTAHKAGTANIIISITGDPSSRKTSCKITVVNRVANSIDIEKLNINDIPNVITSNEVDDETDIRDVTIDYAKLVEYTKLDKNNKIHICIDDIAIDKKNEHFTPTKVTYQSTDTSIATVDKNGYVTFKKEGQVTITCVIASNPKGKEEVSKDIILRAINYAPKIETTKFTLNKYYDYDTVGYPEYMLHIVYSNTLDISPSGTDLSYKLTNLDGSEQELFDIDIPYKNVMTALEFDTFTIKFNGDVDSSTIQPKAYTQLLQFRINEIWYKYKVTIVVTNAIPSATLKVNGKYNTFTNENTLELVPTVKNGTIDHIEFVDNWASIDQNNKITCTKEDGKLVTSGKVRVYFDGYTDKGYIEKTIKLPTTSTKPVVKLNSSSISLFVPENTTDKTVTIQLVDKDKNLISSGKVELINGLGCTVENEDNKIVDGNLSLKITELKKGKINFYYYDTDNSGNNVWNDKIKLTLSVNVSNKYPTAKLSSSTLTLNTHYNSQDSISVNLSSISESIEDIECTNKPGAIDSIEYANGLITVKSTVPGTYKLSLTPYMEDGSVGGYPLKPITLTVKVNSDIPELKLKSTSVTLNSNYAENVVLNYSLNKNKFDKQLIGITASPNDPNNDIADFEFVDNQIKVSLNNAGKLKTKGSYKYKLTPKFTDNVVGKSVTVTIKIINKVASAKVTLSNAFNPLDKDATSLLNIKLSNIAGNIISIDFNSQDQANTLFKIEDDVLKSDSTDNVWKTIKDQTLKTKLKIKTDATGDEYIICDLAIKITRKAPTLKLENTTLNVYNTYGKGIVVGETSFVLSGVNADIKEENIEISESLAYKVEYNDTDDKIVVTLIDGAKLKSGSTNTFTIKVNWDNDYYNGKVYTKTSTVKLNVKDLSYNIKTVN